MEWKLSRNEHAHEWEDYLETFLSGMETGEDITKLPGFKGLETFLSGMETEETLSPILVAGKPLKPSLVEWKQRTYRKSGGLR